MTAILSAWLISMIAAAAAFGASHIRFRRRLSDARRRMEEVERARLAAQQQAAQARTQNEQLQKELAAQHRARAEAISAQQRRAPSIELVRERLERELERPAAGQRGASALPLNAFADTMPL